MTIQKKEHLKIVILERKIWKRTILQNDNSEKQKSERCQILKGNHLKKDNFDKGNLKNDNSGKGKAYKGQM